MLGDGLESLIPSKRIDPPSSRIGADEDIEFPLPDITNGGFGAPSSAGDVLAPPPARGVMQVKSIKNDKKEEDYIFHIETDRISPNPHQPRRNFEEEPLRELANSIREFGVLQPIVVSRIEKEVDTGSAVEYELIAGERRLMAAKMLGLPTIPSIVREAKADVEKLELAVIENIQRENLDTIETARAMARLQDEFGMAQREVATRLGKSRETVSNTMRLLNLPTEMQAAISEGKLSDSQGRLLLSIDDPKIRESFFKDAINQKLSVRDLEARIKRVRGQKNERGGGTRYLDPETSALKERLEEYLGTRVDMKKDGKSGKIIINFYSQEELDSLINKFFKQNDNPPTSHLLET
ncbi:ParB/RepB/Spo0J family partition protein [Patescibacteria group bacterium]|nr:ParB/RepB/Spo0J family partition protein [Patescibacteria group bacterium]